MRRSTTAPRRRWLPALLACGALMLASAAAQALPRIEPGMRLQKALRLLQRDGVRVVFSTALVPSRLRVAAQPVGESPERVLRELLAPHGLDVQPALGERWLVVGALPPERTLYNARMVGADRGLRRLLVLTMCLAPALGCGGGGSSASSPTEPPRGGESTLRLAAEPPTIAGSQTATITVQAFGAGGAPVPAGTAVALATDRGVLGSTLLASDAQGTARTTLGTADAVGRAVVTATVAGITTSTAVTLQPPYELHVSADPPIIGSSGSARVMVQILALDPAAAVANRPLSLTTTLGHLSPKRPQTDGRGVAVACLVAGGASGTAVLTAGTFGAEPATATVIVGGSASASTSDDKKRPCRL